LGRRFGARWPPADGAGALLLREGSVPRAGLVLRAAVRSPARRAWPAGGDAERARDVRLRGEVQPLRRARRRARHAALAARAAVAHGTDRDGGPELPGPRAMGGRSRGGRRPRGAVDPGERLAVPRPELSRRQRVARALGSLAPPS